MRRLAIGCLSCAILVTATPLPAQPAINAQVAAAIQTLQNGTIAERIKAADVLGDHGPAAQAAVNVLAAALDARDEQLRVHAARALGAIGPAAAPAITALSAQLKADSASVRAYAAFALGRIDGKAVEAVPALLAAIEDPDATVRRSAVKAIVEIHPDPQVVLPTFAALLKKSEPAVLLPALNSLAEAGEPAVPLLVEALKDPHARYWACLVLAQIGPQAKAAAPSLAALTKDPDAGIRRESLVALGRIGAAAKDVLPALIGGLDDSDSAVSAAAAFALANLGPDAAPAADALKRHLDDRNPFLRAVATWAWLRVQPGNPAARATALPILVDSLKNSDARVRVAAVHALANLRLNDEAIITALAEALKDPETNVSGVALNALSDLGAAAVPALAASLKDHQARGAAAIALGEMGPAAKAAVPMLVEALADQSPLTRREVLVALAAMGADAASAVPTITSLLADDANADVRHSAAFALGKIGPAAASATAGLLQQLDSKSLPLAVVSAWALAQIAPQDDATAGRAVPVLVRGLKEGKQSVRTEAAQALGAFGPKAAAAVSALEAATMDDNPIVRRTVSEALAKIR